MGFALARMARQASVYQRYATMTDFRIGEQVVCVDAAPCPFYGEVGLVVGKTYTITSVSENDIWNRDGRRGQSIGLREICSRHPDGRYFGERFQPARATDISIFTKMLTTEPAFSKGQSRDG